MFTERQVVVQAALYFHNSDPLIIQMISLDFLFPGINTFEKFGGLLLIKFNFVSDI
jgi:hypothetical protein